MRQAYEILEYDKLKEALVRLVRTPLGATLAQELRPQMDPATVERMLRETGEAAACINSGVSLDIQDLPDPRPALGKLSIAEVNLEPGEILDLLALISVGMGLRDTFRAEAELYPLLDRITVVIPNLRSLYQRLRSAILPSGEVDDFASPGLREARANISRLRAQIQRTLENISKRAEESHALREDFITIRNERYVIPIRNDNRGAVAGVVHGMSSSGQTAFIEPLETIELNNELVRLREIETAEVTKVLFRLSEELREELDGLERTAEAVGSVDFIAARARLAVAQQAIEPKINREGRLFLKDARHPLLEENLRAHNLEIVPISIELDPINRVMVVSGPNAGGKTVVLKTVGLLSLMAQSGLHTPALEADLPIFREVYPDIGDHQSIAANLSTFTAHIENIRRISDELELPALVLLDEVGTGTDPEEGAALGVAIVDYFRSRGAYVIVTTHYGPLKVYASGGEGVINASVEFDERTLKPTYRLLTGLAGSSSGIEIARRFGLPQEITERAASGVTGASAEAAEYLRRLKQQYDEHLQLTRALDEERAAVAAKYEKLETEFAGREKARALEFRTELRKVVDEFATRAEQFAATITDSVEARRVRRDIEKRASELRVAASTAAREFQRHSPTDAVEKQTEPEVAVTTSDGFQIGDRVRILAFGQEGVVESVGDNEIGVQVGALRFREQPENLRLLSRPAASKGTARSASFPRGVSVQLQEHPEGARELNVIGKTVAEAVEEADKFLDQAYMNGFDRIRIVHGIGMGALRRAVTELLTGHPHVSRFETAPPSEGGQGATIVELKK
ncbi:MAG: endonuclease MutS2 [Acidobacteria bacterium]|nr:endonuclease MutS2 [Acidobacteriota bacterium]